MAKKIAVINMKGGVGKSTLCTNLAWHFSAMSRWRRRVLLIDLDPQFNASQYIMGVDKYQTEVINANTPTVWDVFEQQSRAPGLRAANRSLKDAIRPIVQFISGQYIHLVPSQLELSFTLKNPSQKEHLLSNFVADVEADYDLILIDCAPTESVLTTAAYLAADSILVPVKPEFLSTIGLPLIRQSLADFERSYRKTVGVAGISFNMCSDYSPEENKSKTEVKDLATSFGWHVFDKEVPYSRSFPKGAREGKPIFQTSYARSTVAKEVADFCNSFAVKAAI
ncbi:ParA family protein [Rhizobium laguerreae]|uniref:ParA family protein n=1 Tax=Rhizobium laguerreae TaxID=1076926 RepID=UPI001C920ABE|nr:ParA family protein [Rhizobium laguerreae]MBY3198794.1 ParA family protein [Rhizobium laguerreae]MBY3557136.1 ParA family protein [Rhizobium laguerreae]